MSRSTQTLAAGWCLLSAFLFGASTPASKALLAGVGPLTLAGLLYLGAALATLPSSLSGGAAERRRDPLNRRRLLGAIFFGGIAGPAALLYGLSLADASAASVSLWLNLETAATAVLAWLFFQENLDRQTWAANLLVVIAGVILAAPAGFSAAPAAALVALACVCWGLDNNFTATIDGFTPAQTTFAKGLVAGTFNLLLGLSLEPTPTRAVIGGALLIGALSYGASIVLYIRGAQQLGATRSQMLFATAPFLGMAIAWIGLNEPIQASQLLAAGVMVVSLILMWTAHHEHAHAHTALAHTHPHCHNDGHHTHTHTGLPDSAWHTHLHEHEAMEHSHPHQPDLHHRHVH